MKIPKEIGRKVAEYEKLKEKTDKLYEELELGDSENADMDDGCLSGFGVTQEPKEQEENEYCDQHQQGDDSSYGRYYWAIEDNTQYAWASYLI